MTPSGTLTIERDRVAKCRQSVSLHLYGGGAWGACDIGWVWHGMAWFGTVGNGVTLGVYDARGGCQAQQGAPKWERVPGNTRTHNEEEEAGKEIGKATVLQDKVELVL